eukprot:2269749-Ditylum_brightwellii.AAC.1
MSVGGAGMGGLGSGAGTQMYVLQPDGSADPEASSMQALTCISTTSSPTRNGTWVFCSPNLGISLPL